MRDPGAMRCFAYAGMSARDRGRTHVLPSRSKLTEILHALEAPGIEAVLLADGDLVRTVVIREGSS